MHNRLDPQYKELIEHILHFGTTKKDRTGTGTKSIFGWQIRHNMKDGFPLLTTKKMAWKQIVTELLWFLRGDTNIKYLVDNDCHIWDGDAWVNYQRKVLDKFMEDTTIAKYAITSKEEFINKIKTDNEFAKQWGELGPIYGAAWRRYSGASYIPHPRKEETVYQEWHRMGHNSVALNVVDQVQKLVDELKINPDGRRHLVSAWNPSLLSEQILPPCHYSWQVYTRELSLEERAKWLQDTKGYDLLVGNLDHDHIREVVENEAPTRAISLMFNMRSNDVPLGLPFNLASYGLLLEILAKHVNMVPDELITNIGDAHIYLNQIEGVREQITRTPYELPTVKISDRIVNDISEYDIDDFILQNYQYHPSIKIPLSN